MATTAVHDREAPLRATVLTKTYGHRTAVDGLTFAVRAGAVTGFLGPNGAGKSTALRMALGLVRPTLGTATLYGSPYDDLDRPLTVVGALLDTEQFHPGRTGRNHLRAIAATAGLPERRVEDCLEMVEMTEHAGRRVGAYSLGMRQRLGLAGALLGDPRLLVLDEPANGLDPAGIRWLRRVVREFADHGGAVLMSSHQLNEVAQIADDVVLIAQGRLVHQGPLAELLAGSAGSVHVRTDDPDRLVRLLDASRIPAGVRDGLVVARGHAEPVSRVMARAGMPVLEMRTETDDLEDVFFRLTQQEGRDRA